MRQTSSHPMSEWRINARKHYKTLCQQFLSHHVVSRNKLQHGTSHSPQWKLSTTYAQIKLVGVTGALWLGGNIAALSFLAIPALRQSSVIDGVPTASLAKQWRHIYESGKSQNPPVAAITASAFSILSWSAKHALPKSPIALYYGSAAVLTLSIVPFTLVAMSATNSKLMQESGSSAKSATPVHIRDDEIDQLLRKWTRLNAVRKLPARDRGHPWFGRQPPPKTGDMARILA